MDARRKMAYRYLLYQTTVEIRARCSWAGHSLQIWRSIQGFRGAKTARACFSLSDAVHNLAYFSAIDFENFDEEWFWRGFNGYLTRMGDSFSYRQKFDEIVAGEYKPVVPTWHLPNDRNR